MPPDKDFSKGEEAQIKDFVRQMLPDEKIKCEAYRIFEKDGNVEKLFDGFTKIDALVIELKEHKKSHSKTEEEIVIIKREVSICRKGRWKQNGVSFIGSAVGAFFAFVYGKIR